MVEDTYVATRGSVDVCSAREEYIARVNVCKGVA